MIFKETACETITFISLYAVAAAPKGVSAELKSLGFHSPLPPLPPPPPPPTKWQSSKFLHHVKEAWKQGKTAIMFLNTRQGEKKFHSISFWPTIKDFAGADFIVLNLLWRSPVTSEWQLLLRIRLREKKRIRNQWRTCRICLFNMEAFIVCGECLLDFNPLSHIHIYTLTQPRNRFQGIDSASLQYGAWQARQAL
jgi:hypothetical protein